MGVIVMSEEDENSSSLSIGGSDFSQGWWCGGMKIVKTEKAPESGFYRSAAYCARGRYEERYGALQLSNLS